MEDEEEKLPEPDEIINPQPAEEQTWLWQNIEDTLDTETLDRAALFVELPEEAKQALASLEVANRVRRASAEFSLSKTQASLLATLVKYAFLRIVPRRSFALVATKALALAPEQGTALEESFADVLDMVGAFRSLEKRGGSGIAPELDTLSRSGPPAPPSTPQDEASPPPEEDQPFILHEEKTGETPNIDIPREASRPTFSFMPPAPPKPSDGGKPVTVRIETDEGTAAPRIVHYSKLRTPLEDTDANNAK